MRVGRRAPQGTHADGPDQPSDAIVVFPTGRTLARGDAAPDQSVTVPSSPDEAHVPRAPADGHRSYHARPGHRPGGATGATSARAGGETDIVRPLLVAPTRACQIVLAGDVFAIPLPHLRVFSDGFDARFLVWAVAVVGDHVRPVPATLHLLGSPSMVVTVLELVPSRQLRWSRERFVRYGVEAVDALAHRIERAA